MLELVPFDYNLNTGVKVSNYLFNYDFNFNSVVQAKLDHKNKSSDLYLSSIRKNHDCMQFIIDNDCVDIFQDYFSIMNRIHFYGSNEELENEYNRLLDIIFYINEQTGCDSVKVYQQYFKLLGRKIYRISDRIEQMRNYTDDNYSLYFCTITLAENKFKGYKLRASNIDEKNYDKIRIKLRKHIKEFSNVYLFNKDFGLQGTKRLHFHGVALFKDSMIPCITRNTKKLFGFCDFKLIDDKSDYIARYIDKLSFHAMKVNYGKFKENLIYSRYLPNNTQDI